MKQNPRKFTPFLPVLLALFLFSCQSEPDPQDLSDWDKTTLSTKYLREGKDMFLQIHGDKNHRAEDFEKVLTIWKKGLKYQNKNTLIRKEMVTLYFNMARAYMDRKKRLQGLILQAKAEGRSAKIAQWNREVASAESKAKTCYEETLAHLNILLSQRKPQDSREEWIFLKFMLSSHAYLKHYTKVLQIIDSQINSLPEDDSRLRELGQMRNMMEEALRRMQVKKMEE